MLVSQLRFLCAFLSPPSLRDPLPALAPSLAMASWCSFPTVPGHLVPIPTQPPTPTPHLHNHTHSPPQPPLSIPPRLRRPRSDDAGPGHRPHHPRPEPQLARGPVEDLLLALGRRAGQAGARLQGGGAARVCVLGAASVCVLGAARVCVGAARVCVGAARVCVGAARVCVFCVCACVWEGGGV
jgi:hypothetical protein